MTERGTSVCTRTGEYGTWASDWMTRRWISVADVSPRTPARRRSARAAPASGCRGSGPARPSALRAAGRARSSAGPTSRRLALALGQRARAELDDDRPAVVTRSWPLRSTISPRGAWMRTSRTWFSLASTRYWSPESTCRNQSRKKTIANSASAIPPRTATRQASCGVIGGRRSPTGSIMRARSASSPACAGPAAAARAPRRTAWRRRRRGSSGSERESQRRTIAWTGSASRVLRMRVARSWRSSSTLTGALTSSRNWMTE